MDEARIRPIYRSVVDNTKPQMITIISSTKVARVKIDDIELVEKEGRVLHIITADRDYTVYESIETLVPILVDEKFFRPIKSLIINFDHIKEIEKDFINFDSGQSATLGHNNFSKTKSAFKKYLMRYPSYKASDTRFKVAEGSQNNSSKNS